MSVLSLILGIALFGFIVWLILNIPRPAQVKNIIVAVVCVVLILWVLQQFGVSPGLPALRLN